MEQRVLNTRTVKTMGSNGLESFTTVVLDSLHYESHLMCTNCGPLGLKGDQEPSTNRAALSGRSWAHIVHSNDDHRAKTDANRAASKEAKAKRRADKKAAARAALAHRMWQFEQIRTGEAIGSGGQ